MKMPKSGAYSAHQLGSKFYLWHGKTRKNLVVITAHGGYALHNKPFKVPSGMRIHFYAPHGYILKDPGLAAAADGSTSVHDSYDSGRWCPDYELSKFQGRHGSEKETYERIGAGMHRDARIARSREMSGGGELSAAQLSGMKEIIMDVITVRNRILQKSPTLGDVIQAMQKDGLRYKEIYCSFCRCRSGLPDELDRSWNAQLQAPA